MKKPLLYLAGPLFSSAEQGFNVYLREALSPIVDVYLPQEDGGLFVDMVARGVSVEVAAQKVFSGDIAAIRNCHYLLIVMDGRSIDEGAAFELGFAAAIGKTCIGLQTDMRRLLPIGNNPMVTGALEVLFSNIDQLSEWLCERRQPSVTPAAMIAAE